MREAAEREAAEREAAEREPAEDQTVEREAAEGQAATWAEAASDDAVLGDVPPDPAPGDIPHEPAPDDVPHESVDAHEPVGAHRPRGAHQPVGPTFDEIIEDTVELPRRLPPEPDVDDVHWNAPVPGIGVRVPIAERTGELPVVAPTAPGWAPVSEFAPTPFPSVSEADASPEASGAEPVTEAPAGSGAVPGEGETTGGVTGSATDAATDAATGTAPDPAAGFAADSGSGLRAERREDLGTVLGLRAEPVVAPGAPAGEGVADGSERTPQRRRRGRRAAAGEVDALPGSPPGSGTSSGPEAAISPAGVEESAPGVPTSSPGREALSAPRAAAVPMSPQASTAPEVVAAEAGAGAPTDPEVLAAQADPEASSSSGPDDTQALSSSGPDDTQALSPSSPDDPEAPSDPEAAGAPLGSAVRSAPDVADPKASPGSTASPGSAVAPAFGPRSQDGPPAGTSAAPGLRPAAPGPGRVPVPNASWTGPRAPLPTLDDLLAKRPAPRSGPAELGWRGAVRRLSGGLIAPQPGPREQDRRRAVAAVQRSLDGPRTIVVINPKGGAHKTTATLLIAATFGEHRGGYTLAWDNNETRGTLGWRSVPARHTNTAVDLLQDLDRFVDASAARVGDLDGYVRPQRAAGFDVLASDEDAASAASIDAFAFRSLHRTLARFYRVMVVDTGNNMRASNWQAAIEAADQVVIVSTVREDTAQSAAWAIDALRATGHAEAVQKAVTVLSAPAPKRDEELSSRLHEHFGRLTRTVLDVPYDPALVAGTPIDYAALSDGTKDAWLRVAAAVADGL